eukprot:TRINITY_DN43289_c0_g1_i1.p1 TRINITY_DN43289_c0_g1~~TRINITY_DN43289_c0_g1_i1.p1  ORF type:complete len:765 (-),score=190.42 TRINITY_DN43289_c0_g1_i1:688-2982(-)
MPGRQLWYPLQLLFRFGRLRKGLFRLRRRRVLPALLPVAALVLVSGSRGLLRLSLDAAFVPVPPSSRPLVAASAAQEDTEAAEAVLEGRLAVTSGQQPPSVPRLWSEIDSLHDKAVPPYSFWLAFQSAALRLASLVAAVLLAFAVSLGGRVAFAEVSSGIDVAAAQRTEQQKDSDASRTKPDKKPKVVKEGALFLLPKDDAGYIDWYTSKLTAFTDKFKSDAKKNFTQLNGGLKVEKSSIRELRGIGEILDRIQDDIYEESWTTLEIFPGILRSYVPLLTYYTDAAFPPGKGGDAEKVNEQLRFALRFEVGRMFGAVTEFETGVKAHNIRAAEKAFAKMSLSYDRYLKAGNLYAGYDPVASTTVYFEGIDEKLLTYQRLALGQPHVRDEVLVIQGPDKGKVGKVIWLGNDGDPRKPITAVVKLEANSQLGKFGASSGVKEVKAYPYKWIALTQIKRTFQEDFVAATVAAAFACSLTLPLDNIKVRQQSGLPGIPSGGGILALWAGWPSNLGQYCIPCGVLLAGSNYLADYAVYSLDFFDPNDPDLKLLLLIPCGIVSNLVTQPLQVPFEQMNKLVQTGAVGNDFEAFKKVFFERPADENLRRLTTITVIGLAREIPFGALQVALYEIFRDKLAIPYEELGGPIALEPFAWGAMAGAVTGLATNPPDVLISRMVAEGEGGAGGSQRALATAGQYDPPREECVGNLGFEGIVSRVQAVTKELDQTDGQLVYLQGAPERCLYQATEAMIWFAAYEWLLETYDQIKDV